MGLVAPQHVGRDLPGPGIEPLSPSLAGRFLTTAPPGNPSDCFLHLVYFWLLPSTLEASFKFLLNFGRPFVLKNDNQNLVIKVCTEGVHQLSI